MIPRAMNAAPGTRATRVDTRQRRIESLAAEFALLAQRRARVVHQIDLLEQQIEAAAAGFAKLQSRMAWLAQRIHDLDPSLHPPEPEPDPEPEPPPPPPLATTKPYFGSHRGQSSRPAMNPRPLGGSRRS